jgi:hypothetical protein
MSRVTNVLIVTDCGSDDEPPEQAAISHLNEWLAESADGQQLAQIGLEKCGGDKVATIGLYAAAINYLDVDGIVKAISDAPWESPGAVAAYFQTELQPCFVTSPVPVMTRNAD